MTSPSEPASAAAAPVRVLLIDDDAVDRAAVGRALARSGLAGEIVEAATGEAGLAHARAGAFDCVLLDYLLPGTDTFALLEQLRAPEGGGQAVLMLTGTADADIATALIGAGALDYLGKGEMTPATLARAIRFAAARKRAQAAVEAARREAEQRTVELAALNRQKALLFSIIAHDLRNPCQALLGLTEGLGDAVARGDAVLLARVANGVQQAAGEICALTDSLFEWARTQMDNVQPRLGAVALGPVVAGVLAGAAAAAAAKGIALLDSGCSETTVVCDRDMLATVLRNLVGNAIKFTDRGGRVSVTAVAATAGVTVAVTDTGRGIPPERVSTLLEPEKRAHTRGTAGEKGSGLGLLLCQDLLARQGSALAVSSVPGEGSTFRFVLPAA